MSITIANRVRGIKTSPTVALAANAKRLKAQGVDVIDLTVGEPDFPTPQHIKDAAIAAINHDITKYTATDGTPNLKQAICSKFIRENNLHYDLTQIIVSVGAKYSLYSLLQTILNKEDEVIIPAPYWVSYPDMVRLAEGQPVIVTTTVEQNFKITPQQLEQAITPKTKAFIINSPSNPTGAIYTEQELNALAEVLLPQPQIAIISDDIYEHIYWDQTPFRNIINICPKLYERTFVINGVSKSYAMTGWRIGYTAGPTNVIAAMKTVLSQSTSSANSIAQVAAETALRHDQSCIKKMVMEFKKRHDFVMLELNKIFGFSTVAACGAFYLFPDVSMAMQKFNCSTDVEFAELLLNRTNVAAVHGSAFGIPNHLRISYATDMSHLDKALKRIRNFME